MLDAVLMAGYRREGRQGGSYARRDMGRRTP